MRKKSFDPSVQRVAEKLQRLVGSFKGQFVIHFDDQGRIKKWGKNEVGTIEELPES